LQQELRLQMLLGSHNSLLQTPDCLSSFNDTSDNL
jgi:hypothetical protein